MQRKKQEMEEKLREEILALSSTLSASGKLTKSSGGGAEGEAASSPASGGGGGAGGKRRSLCWDTNEKTDPNNLPSRVKQQLAKVSQSPLNTALAKLSSDLFVKFDPFKKETRPGV